MWCIGAIVTRMKPKANARLTESIQVIVEKIMQERNLDVANVDSSVIVDAIHGPAVEVALKAAERAVVDLEHKLGPILLKALNANLVGVENPIPGPGVAWDPHEVERVIAQHEDQLAQLQDACMETVMKALVDYYEEFASVVAYGAHEEGY